MRMVRALILFSIGIALVISLIACEKEVCGNKCLNGGICNFITETCLCVEGYTGSNCGTQMTPSAIRITSVSVTKFPATHNGSNWDSQDGPDIYFQILDRQTLLFELDTIIENADPNKDYLFPIANVEVTHVTGEHTIQLLEFDDVLSHEWMGGVLFTPYWSDTNHFPSKIELDAGSGVAFTLNIEYVF